MMKPFSLATCSLVNVALNLATAPQTTLQEGKLSRCGAAFGAALGAAFGTAFGAAFACGLLTGGGGGGGVPTGLPWYPHRLDASVRGWSRRMSSALLLKKSPAVVTSATITNCPSQCLDLWS